MLRADVVQHGVLPGLSAIETTGLKTAVGDEMLCACRSTVVLANRPKSLLRSVMLTVPAFCKASLMFTRCGVVKRRISGQTYLDDAITNSQQLERIC